MSERPRFSLVEKRDRDDIVAVTLRYLKAHSKVSNISVVCEGLDGSFARVSGRDNSGKIGVVYGFVKRNKEGQWEVLAVGTSFEPEFFKRHGIPEKLRRLNA
jgi:hypothetical protein